MPSPGSQTAPVLSPLTHPFKSIKPDSVSDDLSGEEPSLNIQIGTLVLLIYVVTPSMYACAADIRSYSQDVRLCC